MARLLDNKVAIVTGASRGLGAAVAAALGTDGASVLLVSRRERELRAAAEKVEEAGGKAESCVADITVPGAAGSIVDKALGRFARLDILVNCAGHFVWQKFFDVSPDDWNRTLTTNLSAPFFLIQEAARVMANQGRGGSIVNIASIHGSVGDPNVVPHCASKFGLVGLTRATAEALREHDIRVNAIAPGAIEPDSGDRRGQTPREKVTQADIATLVAYLSSDLARSISGSVIDTFGSTRTVIKV